MTGPKNTVDPYSPEDGYYECLNCDYRVCGGDRPSVCPECSGEIRNIAVPRE